MTEARRGDRRAWAWTVRRLITARWVRRSAVLGGVVAAVIVLAQVVVGALTLSASQVVERDLGTFDALVTPNQTLRPGDRSGWRVLARLTSGESEVVLTSLDVVPAMTPAGSEAPRYLETDWERAPYPATTVSRGRWPTEAGEILLGGSLADRHPVGSTMSVLSGAAELRVVGTAHDRYFAGPGIYAAPGTWARLPPRSARAREGVGAFVSVLSREAEVPALVSALRTEGGAPLVVRRAEVGPERSWLAESPFAFVVPVLLVPLLAGAAGVSMAARRARRFVVRVSALGMSSRLAGSAVLSAFCAAMVPTALVGAVLGAGFGHAARPVLALWSPRGLGPPGFPAAATGLVVGGLLLGMAAAFAALRIGPPRGRRRTGRGPAARHQIRRWSALVLACAGIFLGFRVVDGTSAMIFGAAVLLTWLLTVPDAAALLARGLPVRGPLSRLTSRLLLARQATLAATMALITVLLVLPTTTALLMTATGSAARDNALADAAPGQVVLMGRGGLADGVPAGVRQLVLEALDVEVADTVQVHVVDAWYDVRTGNALVVAVEEVGDVPRLLGADPSAAQRKLLRDGGFLAWQPGHTLLVGDAAASVRSAEFVPAPEWRKQTGALMTLATAGDLGATATPGAVVVSGVSPSAAHRARDALVEAGRDPSLLHLHSPPAAIAPPLPLAVSLAVLVLLMLLTALVTARSHAAGLQRYAARLVAVGARRAFATRVVLLQQGVAFAGGTLAAAVICLATVASLTLNTPSVEMEPPVALIVAYCAAMVAAMLLGSTMFATRSARPSRDD